MKYLWKLMTVCIATVYLVGCSEKKAGHECVYFRDPTQQMDRFVIKDDAGTNLLASGKLKKDTLTASQSCDRYANILQDSLQDEFTLLFSSVEACGNVVYLKWQDNDTDTLSYTCKREVAGSCYSIYDIQYYFNGRLVKQDASLPYTYVLIK